MIEKLKPCPFCGGEFSFDDGIWKTRGNPCTYYIQCPHCEAEIANDYSVDVAIKRWNTRANGWHDVRKELPKNGREVMIFVVSDGGGYPEFGNYSYGKWIVSFCKCEGVVAWRELPEPPEFGNG